MSTRSRSAQQALLDEHISIASLAVLQDESFPDWLHTIVAVPHLQPCVLDWVLLTVFASQVVLSFLGFERAESMFGLDTTKS